MNTSDTHRKLTKLRVVTFGLTQTVSDALASIPWTSHVDYGGRMANVRRAAPTCDQYDLLIFGPNPTLYTPASASDIVSSESSRIYRMFKSCKEVLKAPKARHFDLSPFDSAQDPALDWKSWVDPAKLRQTELAHKHWREWQARQEVPQREPPTAGQKESVTRFESYRDDDGSEGPPEYPDIAIFLPCVVEDMRVDTDAVRAIEAFLRDPFRPLEGEPDLYQNETSGSRPRTIVFVVEGQPSNSWTLPNARLRNLFSLSGSKKSTQSPIGSELGDLLKDLAPFKGSDLNAWISADGLYGSSDEEGVSGYISPRDNSYMAHESMDGRTLAVAFFDRQQNRIVILSAPPQKGELENALVSIVANAVLEQLPKEFKAPIRNARSRPLQGDTIISQAKLKHSADQPAKFEIQGPMVTQSAAWHLCITKAMRICARSRSHLLLVGPTGAGKEIAARCINQARPEDIVLPYIEVNCASLGDATAASQLFGHKKGAFTGAVRDTIGLVQHSDKGTMFLDEFQEALNKPNVAPQLLRFMETGEFYRFGEEEKKLHSDIRIIAATNDLAVLEDSSLAARTGILGRFSSVVRIPGILARWSDVEPLVEYFTKDTALELQVTLNDAELGQAAAHIVDSLDVRQLAISNIRYVKRAVFEYLVELPVSKVHRIEILFPKKPWEPPERLLQALREIAADPQRVADFVPQGTYLGYASEKSFRNRLSSMNPGSKSKQRRSRMRTQAHMKELTELLSLDTVKEAVQRHFELPPK